MNNSENPSINNLGVIDYMLLFQQLLHSGYQKLRWISEFAPSGCAFRCNITTQDNIFANRELVHYDKNHVWSISVSRDKADVNLAPYIKDFLFELSPILEKGSGSDPEYLEWFDKVVSFAQSGKRLPQFNGDYFCEPLGYIKIGEERYQAPPMSLRLISWNIDGVKAHFGSLKQMVAEYQPDIICLQKYKDNKASAEFELPGYKRNYSLAAYAGVATYIKEYLSHELFDIDSNETFKGHLLVHKFIYPAFTLFNVYVPFSNPTVENAIEHRRYFDSSLFKLLSSTPDRSILCGDFNIVHTERDCWDGKYQRNQANFHEWERNNFDLLLNGCNLIDTYRHFNFFGKDFSYFFRNDPEVRAKNNGHRIDYFLASRSFEPQITRADIIKNITASTNNPILLEFRY